MPFLFLRILTGALLVSLHAMDADAQDRYAAERKAMLEEIARDARDTFRETGRAQLSERVMRAMVR
ncbi:MAG: hypothetical protein ACXWUI_05845, partial [Burkholderiales bacterium]